MTKRLTPAHRATLTRLGRAGIEGEVGERNAAIFVAALGLFGNAKLSLAELGRANGMSRERVRQIVERTKTRIGLTPEGVQ